MEAYQEELAKIKTLLRKEPRGMTIKEISHKIGINRNSVAKYMEMLLVSGQAEIKRVGRAKIYFHSQRVPVSALLDYSSEYIIVVNREGRIILVNDAILGWMGHEREALVGKTLDDAPGYISDNQDLRNGVLLGLQGQASNMEVPVRTRGETLHFRIKSIPTTFEDGEIGVTVLMEDITERKRMLEELLIKDHAMESSINAFALSNLEGILTYVNPSFLKLWGYEDEDEVLGRPATDFTQPEEHASKVIEALRDTGSWRGELVALRKDGTNPVVEMTASMVKDETGNPLCMMASFLDITERKEAEEAQKERVKELSCLYGISRLVESDLDLEGILEGVVTLIPPAWHYPEETCARITLEGRSFETDNFRRTPHTLSADIRVRDESVGAVEVCNLGERPEGPGSLFLEEERDLINAVAERLGEIIEQKRMEEELWESEEKYRAVVEGANDGIVIVQGKFIRFANNRFAEMLDYGVDELTGVEFQKVVPPEKLSELFDWQRRWLAGEDVPPLSEIDIVQKNGERIPVEVNIGVIRYEGEPANLGYIRDITERKQMMEELLIKDHAMESSINAFALSNLEGVLTYVNPSFLELWGYEDEGEVLGRHAADVSQTEEYASKVIEALRDTGIWRGELTTLRKDGSNLVVEMTASMVKDEKGSPLCMMASFFDVTERKRYEEELRNSEERWRSLVELAPDGIITMDLKGVITSVNTAEVTLTGYSKDEFVGKHFSKMGFVHARDIPKYVEIVGSILKGEIPPPIEVAYTHKDGTASWAEAHISLLEVGGEKIGIQAIMRDITGRKKAEESLKESEEWHRAVFEGSLDAIFITGEDSRIVDVNEAAEILTGYSKEELEGMSIPDLHDAPDLHAYESYFDRIMAGEAITSEAEILRKDGIKVSTEFSNSRILIRGVPYMHTTARNITERKRMESKLREYAENLEDLVEERTRELQDAKIFAEL